LDEGPANGERNGAEKAIEGWAGASRQRGGWGRDLERLDRYHPAVATAQRHHRIIPIPMGAIDRHQGGP